LKNHAKIPNKVRLLACNHTVPLHTQLDESVVLLHDYLQGEFGQDLDSPFWPKPTD